MDERIVARFESKVLRTDNCWVWTGGTYPAGYGRFFPEPGRGVRAHRFAYELWCGSIEDKFVIHHKCGNRICVRPDHLQAVSQHENTAEMFERNGYLKAIDRLERELKQLREELEQERRRDD